MTRRSAKDRAKLAEHETRDKPIPTYDLADRKDFERFAELVGKRTAKAIRFGIAYGVPYRAGGSHLPKRPGAYAHVTAFEFDRLYAAFGSKR